jgi:nitrile hydratase
LTPCRFRPNLVVPVTTEVAMSEGHAERIAAIHRELHSHLPTEPALRVKALESLLVEKGLLDPKTVDAWIEVYTEQIGPRIGAAVVARAWTDPGFRDRLLADGTAAVTEMGFEGAGSGHLKVLPNTPAVHNLVVCTLCSCYPLALLGIPPNWYKTAAYRSRAVRDPRSVIAEFGEAVPDEVEVRVWDSTAELRYLVLPERPAGTAGWDAARLAGLVTRNAMIGTERDLGRRVGVR